MTADAKDPFEDGPPKAEPEPEPTPDPFAAPAARGADPFDLAPEDAAQPDPEGAPRADGDAPEGPLSIPADAAGGEARSEAPDAPSPAADPFAAAGDPESPPPDSPRPEQPPETPPDAPPETPPDQPPESPPDQPPETPPEPEETPPEIPPETDPNTPDPDAPPPETPPEPPSEDPLGPPDETPPEPPPEAPEPPSEVPPPPPPETPPYMAASAAPKTVVTFGPRAGAAEPARGPASATSDAPRDAGVLTTPPSPPPAARDAAPPGAEADLEDLIARPWAWELFAAVEAVHAARPELPSPGRSSRIAEDPVRLRQRPTLAFRASPIVAARRVAHGGREAIEIEQVAFGPLGPAGPLPVHVTDDAIHEAKEGRPWLSGFLDLFTHRMLHLMVRAWQSARLASRRAFTADDPWPRWIASLFGAGPAEFRSRDALPDDLKLFMAGWFASKRRSAAAFAGVLEGAVGAPVEVQEHAPEWLAMPEAEQSRLGAQGSTLGRDLMLGPRFFSLQSRLRVRTAPLDAESFQALLPGGPRLAAARDAARFLMGLAASWELQLRLRPEAVPDLMLDGRRRLGLDSWLRADRRGVAEDVVLEGAPPPPPRRPAPELALEVAP